MIDLPIYTTQGKSAGEMAIDEAHFGTRVRPKLLKQAKTIEESGQRIAELVREVGRELRAGTKLLEAGEPEI